MAQGQTSSSTAVSFGTSQCVTVLVGANEQSFTVHEDVLLQDSRFFKAALSGQFKEAVERIIRLPETNPVTFNNYLRWAYSGQLVLLHSTEVDEVDLRCRLWTSAATLYVFAVYAGNIKLQNRIIDRMKAYGPPTGTEPVRIAYEELPESSKFRKFVLNWHLRCRFIRYVEGYLTQLPATFIQDLALGWAEELDGEKKHEHPMLSDKCFYHEHNAEVPKCD